MTPEWQALLGGAVGMGAPLVLAIWELARTRHDRGNWDFGGGTASPAPKPKGDAPARPLPACLRPVLPARPHVPATGPVRRPELV